MLSKVIILASCLMAEAEGEGHIGINAVADTIANRAERRNVEAVVIVQQPGQYATLSAKQRDVRARRSPAAWVYCLEVGSKLAQGKWISQSRWTHFYSPARLKKAPSWSIDLKDRKTIGNHVFGELE